MRSRLLPWLLALLVLLGGTARGAEPKLAVSVGQSGEAFIVDATLNVQVPLPVAWDVLVDFDHMSSILGNLTASKVVARDRNIVIVQQQGVARFGLLSFAFESEREMRLEPMQRILARNISGTLKRMESETTLSAPGQGVQIQYHAEIVSDSAVMRLFGVSFVKHEIEEQFMGLAREMIRRQARGESLIRQH